MKIGVAAMGESLDEQVSGQFGRCPYFIIVDPDTLEFEAFSNPAASMPGGAGPAAVQELVNHGANTALAGRVGPKAEQALEAAGIKFIESAGTVREAVQNCSGKESDA